MGRPEDLQAVGYNTLKGEAVMAEGAMSAFLADIGTIVTQILTWVGSVGSTIVG